MSPEIERKFLLDSMPDDIESVRSEQIEQGYLAVGPDSEVRLRRADAARILAVKRGSGLERLEVEVELSESQFAKLWAATEGRDLTKRRLYVPLGENTAEIDRYEGKLDGLITAEVEFESIAESEAFDPPSWFGPEVTGDRRFKNQDLAAMDTAPHPRTPHRNGHDG